MWLMPNSITRRSTASAWSRSRGGPKTPGPGSCMAPKPTRPTVYEPIWKVVMTCIYTDSARFHPGRTKPRRSRCQSDSSRCVRSFLSEMCSISALRDVSDQSSPRCVRSVLSEDVVDLAARVVDDVDNALLLLRRCRVRGLRNGAHQLADGAAQGHRAGIGAFGDLVPRSRLDLLGGGPTVVGQFEELLAALGFRCDEEAFVDEQLQRRVHRAGAGLPQLLAAFVDLLDHLVAMHGPGGEQFEDRSTHVTAPPASAAAGSAATATSAEAGSESATGAE